MPLSIRSIPQFASNWPIFERAVSEALAVNVFASTERVFAFAAPVPQETIFTWMANVCRAAMSDFTPFECERFSANWFADIYEQGAGLVLSWYPEHQTIDGIRTALHDEGEKIGLTHYEFGPACGRLEVQFRIVKALMKMHLKAGAIRAMLDNVACRSAISQKVVDDIERLLQQSSFDDYELFVAAFHGNFNPSHLSVQHIDRRALFEEYRKRGRQYRANAPQPPYDSGFEEDD